MSYTFNAGNKKPYLDQEGLLHWPVLFMYPEVMQNDVVEDVAEADTLQVRVQPQHQQSWLGPEDVRWAPESVFGCRST